MPPGDGQLPRGNSRWGDGVITSVSEITAPAALLVRGGCDIGCTCSRGSRGLRAWFPTLCPPRWPGACHLPSQGGSALPWR